MIRLVYFGMTGLFSIPPLAALLEAGADPAAVIVPADQSARSPLPRQLEPPSGPPGLRLLTPSLNETVVQLAWQHSIPVWAVGKPSEPDTLALLSELQPDLIAVVCFPYRFPPDLLALPRHGCLNLHPSKLPAYRGPTPLFWQVRHNERRIGVTLHFLNEALDQGEIIFQTEIALTAGMGEAELTIRAAAAGGALLVRAMQRLNGGQSLPRRPQSEAEASYFPPPTPPDLSVPLDWPAQRAFDFCRGAESWPLTLSPPEATIFIDRVLSFEAGQSLPQAFVQDEETIRVRFNPGVLTLRGRIRLA